MKIIKTRLNNKVALIMSMTLENTTSKETELCLLSKLNTVLLVYKNHGMVLTPFNVSLIV